MRRRGGKIAAVAAAHGRHRIRRADQRRQRDVGGMRIADRIVLHRAQAKPLRWCRRSPASAGHCRNRALRSGRIPETARRRRPPQAPARSRGGRHRGRDWRGRAGRSWRDWSSNQSVVGGAGIQDSCSAFSFREGRNRIAGRGPWLCRWILFRIEGGRRSRRLSPNARFRGASRNMAASSSNDARFPAWNISTSFPSNRVSGAAARASGICGLQWRTCSVGSRPARLINRSSTISRN